MKRERSESTARRTLVKAVLCVLGALLAVLFVLGALRRLSAPDKSPPPRHDARISACAYVFDAAGERGEKTSVTVG